MESKEFKKVALYFDENGYNENLQTQEETKGYLQNIIDRIKSLGFTDFTKISLEDIFLNPKNFFIYKSPQKFISLCYLVIIYSNW